MKILADKVAIISGGTRGIGLSIALKMAEAGADLAIIYAGNHQAAALATEKIATLGGKVKKYQCDIADFKQSKETVAAIISDLGGPDILVNNAGVTADKLIFQMTEEDYDRVLDVNLKGAFNLIKHTYPLFIRRRAGSIINITSVVGLIGNAGQANYAAAKAGLVGLTKSVAKELAGRGITCNAVAPGFIQTDMTALLNEKQKEAYLSQIPLKKWGKPEDVAELALFLAADCSRYITGEVIKVDGGMTM
jgi:3-oxoacyl-[acyl-carrier protein] reductase